MTERQGYGDADAKRIIQRAAEIDAERGRELDAPALREIAAEAGISPLAVDRALAEHESTLLAPDPWLKRHRTGVIVAATVVLLLFFYFVMRIAPPSP